MTLRKSFFFAYNYLAHYIYRVFFQWFDSKKWWFKGIEQSTTMMMASWKNWLSFQCQSFRLLPIDLSKENGFFSETSSFVIVIGAIAVFCIYFLSWKIKFSYFGFLHAKRRWNRLKWMAFFVEVFLSLFWIAKWADYLICCLKIPGDLLQIRSREKKYQFIFIIQSHSSLFKVSQMRINIR